MILSQENKANAHILYFARILGTLFSVLV